VSVITVLRPGASAGETQIDYGYLGSVRAAGAELGPVLVGGRVRGGLGVLRRGGAAAGFRQLEDRVIRADLYDPLLNRAYAEMAEHYGCLIDPARAAKPKDKPRVERVMQK